MHYFKKSLLFIILCLLLVGCQKDLEEKEPTVTTETDIITPSEKPQEAITEDPKVEAPQYEEDKLTYELIFEDNFDYEGKPNPKKWLSETGGNGFGNNEEQYYTDGENASVSDGILTIEARKELYKSSEYTSAKLSSKMKLDIKYGIVEIRAQLPQGKGTWPALWMLPSSINYGGWPNSGEIDIMEHVGFDMNVIHGTIHTKAFNHMLKTQKAGIVNVGYVDSEFHTYKIEWLPTKIKFFVDDNNYFTYDPSEYVDEVSPKSWPFDQKFYLIMNLAIGGNWAGQQGIDDSIFPQKMLIDYVKVYQATEITQWDATQE